MTSRVSSKNKEKRPKGKIVLKKETKQGNKTVHRKRKQRRRESNPVYLHMQITVVSLANLHKSPVALARYCICDVILAGGVGQET